ncbi:hypothetical protein Lalb_Chr07g0194531 [Lupinus albus]|uniref:Uncharacterized protein n=1 Tax=Lupinus albus TaxID=3870 RepID=A0A6A4QBC4_LUPAL|nr:hypothetical protein Lalb_Chr07g0194531 [Lupinus albus]
MKMERGPSPLLPSLLVIGFGFLICWSTLFSILEMLLSIFQLIFDKSFIIFILLILVLIVFVLIYLHSSCPFFGKLSKGLNHQVISNSNHDYDGFEFGIGTLLLVFLFIVLYNLV